MGPEPMLHLAISRNFMHRIRVVFIGRVESFFTLLKDNVGSGPGGNKVRCHHPYVAQQADELTLNLGDVVQVESYNEDRWWLGRNLMTGRRGLFPSNFVMPLSEEALDAPAVDHGRVEAAYDYEAQAPDELALKTGDIITVVAKDDGWWTGQIGGRVGVFPENFVKPYGAEKREESFEIKAEAGGPKVPSAVLNDDKAGGNEGRTTFAHSLGGKKADLDLWEADFKLASFGVKKGGIGSILSGSKANKGKSKAGKDAIGKEVASPHQRDLPPIPAPSVPEKVMNRRSEGKESEPDDQTLEIKPKESTVGDEPQPTEEESPSESRESVSEDKKDASPESEKEPVEPEAAKGNFKPAAYGVKMGGIGSLMASGPADAKLGDRSKGNASPVKEKAFEGILTPTVPTKSHLSEDEEDEETDQAAARVSRQTSYTAEVTDKSSPRDGERASPTTDQAVQPAAEKPSPTTKPGEEAFTRERPWEDIDLPGRQILEASSPHAIEPVELANAQTTSPSTLQADGRTTPLQSPVEENVNGLEERTPELNKVESPPEYPPGGRDADRKVSVRIRISEGATLGESCQPKPDTNAAEASPESIPRETQGVDTLKASQLTSELSTRSSSPKAGSDEASLSAEASRANRASDPLAPPAELIAGPRGKRPASRKPRAVTGVSKPLTQSELLEREVLRETDSQPPVEKVTIGVKLPVLPTKPVLARLNAHKGLEELNPAEKSGRSVGKLSKSPLLEKFEREASIPPSTLGGGSLQERLKAFMREELAKVREEFRAELDRGARGALEASGGGRVFKIAASFRPT
ncbi:hypothetical protein L0F63_005153 [Massospora cicadina]|nr:hypothetical protein L0F63_005153 [Massospora cicadina]